MRVRFLIDPAQPPAGDMRVDLGCRDALMPQQLLYEPYVRTAVHHMGGEGMPERMRREFLLPAKPGPVFIKDNMCGAEGQPPAFVPYQECIALLSQ